MYGNYLQRLCKKRWNDFRMTVDKNTEDYKGGRKVGIVIGAISVGFLLTLAHVIANGILYWR